LQTTLITCRLQLFVLERPFLEAFASSRAALSRLIALSIPDEWPVTSELIPFVLGQFDSSPQIADWLPWAIVDLQTKSLIGDAGFKGAPDDRGGCEIGYSIIPSFRRRGYATEAVGGILSWARQIPHIRTIRAEALESNLASQRVLEKHGFLLAGIYDHAEDGLTRRYELSIPTEMA
jgi:[ribosomal protein S5]-alanine N-acetyltransferase